MPKYGVTVDKIPILSKILMSCLTMKILVMQETGFLKLIVSCKTKDKIWISCKTKGKKKELVAKQKRK